MHAFPVPEYPTLQTHDEDPKVVVIVPMAHKVHTPREPEYPKAQTHWDYDVRPYDVLVEPELHYLHEDYPTVS